MSWYNHFSECHYEPIMFKDLLIGDEFRRGNAAGRYIISIKTGDLTYVDKKSKKQHKLHSSDNYRVYNTPKQTTK